MIELLRTPFRKRSAIELLYALLGLPLAIPGFLYVLLGPAISLAMTAVLLGLPLFVLVMRGARGLGAMYRGVARRILSLKVVAPAPRRPRPGLVGAWTSALSDSIGWRAILYMLIKLPLGLITFVAAVAFWAYGLGLLTYPLWRLLPIGGLPQHGNATTNIFFETVPNVLTNAIVGLVVLMVAPWVVRGLVQLDRLLVSGLLGATTLTERVRDLEHIRNQTVDDAAAALRRIERDLHDGTQARLVSLAMKIGLAKEELAGVSGPVDLAAARIAIDAAHQSAKAALVEVRDLARGIHPPALDRGLDAALATLAARSPVPVTLDVDLMQRPSPAVETIAYYCVAELLTNIAKHSGARQARITVGQNGERMRVRVADDGAGGASHDGGTGLVGLAERVRTVDGRLDVDSPEGGPTVIEIDMPTHV
ncbi:MAG TPA: sensor domain-containing protein [Micromonosporaceae bacterium]|jgi:signal transduction histidine kinase